MYSYIQYSKAGVINLFGVKGQKIKWNFFTGHNNFNIETLVYLIS